MLARLTIVVGVLAGIFTLLVLTSAAAPNTLLPTPNRLSFKLYDNAVIS